MDKVGIPRSLFYYYYGDIWECFFDRLNIEYIVSPETNREIMDRGVKTSQDEMCLAFKTYLGHIDYLRSKCDYILVPRICNYKSNNQTCTNFLAAYDIVNNLMDMKVLNYNIDLEKGDTLKRGLFKIGKVFGKKYKEMDKAYKEAMYLHLSNVKRKNVKNKERLQSSKTKVLIVSHPYNTYDRMIGFDIIEYLKKKGVEVIFSDSFDGSITAGLSKKLSENLYFKYSKEAIGSIIYAMDKIDGIIFLTSFPCGPDSLVNELVIRKIKKYNINIVIDSMSSFEGIETRLESFLDVIRGNVHV